MSDLRKVRPGERLRIPASAFNAFIDAAREFQRRQRDVASQGVPRPLPPGQVYVRVGWDADRFDVVGVGGVAIGPDVNLAAFQDQPVFEAVGPTAGTPFMVLAEPVKQNAVGRAWASGVCPVRLNLQAAGDGWADVDSDGETTREDRLLSGPNGSARILWCEDPATPGEQWALVQIGLSAAPRPSDSRFEDEADPEELGPGLQLDADQHGRPVLRVLLEDDAGQLTPLMFTAAGKLTIRAGHGIAVNSPGPGVQVKPDALAGPGLGVEQDKLKVMAATPLDTDGTFLVLLHDATLAVGEYGLGLPTLHEGGTFSDPDGNTIAYDQFGRITANTPP